MSNKEASCARCEQVMMWGGGGRSWPGRMDCWVWVRAPAVNTEIGGNTTVNRSQHSLLLARTGLGHTSHEGLVLINILIRNIIHFPRVLCWSRAARSATPPSGRRRRHGESPRRSGVWRRAALCNGRLQNGDYQY